MKNAYLQLGSLVYLLVLPFMRLFIKRSSRAYVILLHKDEVLVLKNWLGRHQWQLPGGGVKKNESPRQAAARELLEELNVSIGPSQLKQTAKGKWKTDNLGYTYYIFVAQCEQKPKIRKRPLEIIDTHWIHKDGLNVQKIPTELLAAAKNLP